MIFNEKKDKSWLLFVQILSLTHRFDSENTTPIRLGIKKSRWKNVNRESLKYYFSKVSKLTWPILSALSSHTVFVALFSDQSADICAENKVK